jgi:hypothetical protein
MQAILTGPADPLCEAQDILRLHRHTNGVNSRAPI